MRPAPISLENIQQLPIAFQMTVPPDYEDANGHMNIKFYIAIFEQAWYPFLAQFSLPPDFEAQHGTGGFDLEHHLHYLNEVRIGDTVAVYMRLVGRSPKRLHGMAFMLNQTRQQVAATFEFVTVYVDLQTRKTAPYPEPLNGLLNAMLAQHDHLNWPAPTCGVMSA
jgi:acyl-CoA thioester hydrolase